MGEGTPSQQLVGDNDAETRRALLETSYKEILDATKHQDDKIGRLLTGIAFLTAAALAFANQSGIGITTRHDLIDRRLPLLALAVGAFVVGVIFTVILLLSSLTTGLTLPGSSAPRAWTPQDERSSLIYFYSIAALPKHVWQERWQEPAAKLRADLDADYVNETFNLAQRTNHKYTRTNEAVAALSFTLFALGAAFVLACTVATTSERSHGMVPFTWYTRGALGAFTGSYVAVQVLVARREHVLRLRTRGKSRNDDAARYNEFRVYQFAMPVVAAALVGAGRAGCTRVVAMVLIAGALMAIAVVLASRQKKGRVLRFAILVFVAAGVSFTFLWRDETWRLLAATGVPLGLTIRNFIEHWRRSRPPAEIDSTEGRGSSETQTATTV